MNNNFDTSTTGINIEYNICHDDDLAQHYFNENFSRLKENHYIFSDNEQLIEEPYFAVKGTQVNKRKFILDDNQYLDSTDLKGMLKPEIDEMVIEKMSELFFIDDCILCKNEVTECLTPFNLEIETPFTIIEIRGYCQGDYASVYVDMPQLAKLWGTKPDIESLEEHFVNLFFDKPIYGMVTINGNEIDATDFIKDLYVYDKEEILKGIVNIAMIRCHVAQTDRIELTKALNDLLPENIES